MLKRTFTAVALLTLVAGTQLFSQQARNSPESGKSGTRMEPQDSAGEERLRSRFIDAVSEKARLMSHKELQEAVADAEDWAESRLKLLNVVEQLQGLMTAHPDTDDSARAAAALKILKGDGATRDKIDQLLEKRARIRELEVLSRPPATDHSAEVDAGRKELLDDLVAEWQPLGRDGSGLILATIGPSGSPNTAIGFFRSHVGFAKAWKYYADKCGIDHDLENGYLMTGAGQSGLVEVKRGGSRHSTFGFRSGQYTAVVSLRDDGKAVFGQLTIVLH